MVFKINIPGKEGKTYKVELETESFSGKSLGDQISGSEILPDLSDYEFEISGTSDKSGFTSMKGVPGVGLKRILLTYGKGMHKRQKKEGKKKRSNPTPKGLRLRKTVRGEVISDKITQINLKTIKEGKKPLSDIFGLKEKAEPEKEAQ
jgi:ribosomal protein S6E (S10)